MREKTHGWYPELAGAPSPFNSLLLRPW